MKRECDTKEFEIRSMRNAFGPFLPVLLEQAGITGFHSRRGIDRHPDLPTIPAGRGAGGWGPLTRGWCGRAGR